MAFVRKTLSLDLTDEEAITSFTKVAAVELNYCYRCPDGVAIMCIIVTTITIVLAITASTTANTTSYTTSNVITADDRLESSVIRDQGQLPHP